MLPVRRNTTAECPGPPATDASPDLSRSVKELSLTSRVSALPAREGIPTLGAILKVIAALRTRKYLW